MGNQLKKDIKKMRRDRRIIADEQGNLKLRKDWKLIERARIWLNKWWIFVLLILAICQVIQLVITIVNLGN